MPFVGTYNQDRTEITVGYMSVDDYFAPGSSAMAGASASLTITFAADDAAALANSMRLIAALHDNPNRRMTKAHRRGDIARAAWLADEQRRRRAAERPTR